MKPILYIVCGPAGAGKTYFLNNFRSEYAHKEVKYVSRDEIRFSLVNNEEEYFSHERTVFKKFSGEIAQALVEGADVIADATHLTINSRKKLTNAIDKYVTNYHIVYIILKTPLEVCLKRNAERSGRQKVDENVIARMFYNFTIPNHEDSREIYKIIVEEYSDGKNLDNK